MVEISAKCERCSHKESSEIPTQTILQHSSRGLLSFINITYIAGKFICKKCKKSYDAMIEKQKEEQQKFF